MIWHGAWILWAIFLAVAMLTPSDKIPESKLLSYDKVAHFGVFLMHSFLLSMAFSKMRDDSKRKIKRLSQALTISIVYGVTLEFLQQFIPGRMTDIYDLLANTIGAILGTIVFITFSKNKFAILKLIL